MQSQFTQPGFYSNQQSNVRKPASSSRFNGPSRSRSRPVANRFNNSMTVMKRPQPFALSNAYGSNGSQLNTPPSHRNNGKLLGGTNTSNFVPEKSHTPFGPP
jgi:hypothetical protein